MSTDWVCPGHEIVGKVIHVGEEAASEFPVGSVAGVGAQVQSCMKCDRCLNDNENYCPKSIDTYNASFLEDGKTTQGGYSTMIRTDKRELCVNKCDSSPYSCVASQSSSSGSLRGLSLRTLPLLFVPEPPSTLL